ncbi:colanic acid biosynthesis glycosyltransferase WcaL [Sporolactobacillus sp. THM7-7]|nr:colanic acid biosynthesis glycosyltransferase WcaL [Sporolactobacillus sp. THM7-7]
MAKLSGKERSDAMMHKVAVIRNWFLPISETFIYSELVHLNTFTPIVCCKKEMNREHFPFKPVFTYKSKKELAEILRREQVDLIHARFGVTGAELLNIKQKLNIPMLTSFHGFDLPTNFRSMEKYNGKLDRLFKEGDAFTVTSNNMKKILIDFGCPKHKITVHYSGIDVSKFSFRSPEIPSNGVMTILSVGRLVKKKGMAYLIDAFSQVYRQYPHVHLRIAGDGHLRSKLKKQVNQLKLDDAVTFLGALSYEDIIREMQQAHLFVLASTTTRDGNQEGIPNVLKEALASGLPVVSTKHAGIPELVRHGESGILVPERDTTAIAQSLLHLIKNPDQWHKMAKKGRKTVKRLFNTKIQINELERIYSHVLDQWEREGKERSND